MLKRIHARAVKTTLRCQGQPDRIYAYILRSILIYIYTHTHTHKLTWGLPLIRRYLLQGHTAIGEVGVAAIAEALKGNVALDELWLSENRLTARSALHLRDMLMMNSVLTELDVHGNNLGAKGAAALAEVSDHALV